MTQSEASLHHEPEFAAVETKALNPTTPYLQSRIMTKSHLGVRSAGQRPIRLTATTAR
jgi:hypothetical protein